METGSLCKTRSSVHCSYFCNLSSLRSRTCNFFAIKAESQRSRNLTLKTKACFSNCYTRSRYRVNAIRDRSFACSLLTLDVSTVSGHPWSHLPPAEKLIIPPWHSTVNLGVAVKIKNADIYFDWCRPTIAAWQITIKHNQRQIRTLTRCYLTFWANVAVSMWRDLRSRSPGGN